MSEGRIRNRKPLRAVASLIAILGSLAPQGDSFRAAAAGKSKFNNVIAIGDKAPEWENLPGVDGKSHSLADYRDAKAVVIVFTCNHCPVAKMHEDRLIELSKKYEKDVQVLAISVSRNAADGLDKMKNDDNMKHDDTMKNDSPKQN